MYSVLTQGAWSALIGCMLFAQCTQKPNHSTNFGPEQPSAPVAFGGYESEAAWGEHLVTITGCNDCHTPKIMTEKGPQPDMSRMLSGHPADMPRIDVDRQAMESKGYAVAMDLTEWVGPWGVSFAANLTPHGTGIGNWTEEQFIYALREGKAKGVPGARQLLPPMPWEMFRHMTDGELKAIFAYLQSIKPVDNLVPMPEPPVLAAR